MPTNHSDNLGTLFALLEDAMPTNVSDLEIIESLQNHQWKFCVTGIVGGALIGAMDTAFSIAMGYEVLYRGQPGVWHQLAFHMIVFACLGWLAGLILEKRSRLQEAVTIIQRQYANLKASQEQVIQSEKMAVIGRLSASIAHEIRNPLGIMRSSAGLVSEDLPPDHPSQQPLEFIREEIDRVSNLIGSLLVFAKPKDPLVGAVEVDRVVDRAVTFMQPEFRKRSIQVVRREGPGMPPVSADSDQIHQVILGLLVNAAQAMNDRGTLTLDTRLSDGAGKVVIEVTDDGPGIPPENQERVFEPFFTTKKEGTGLGLSVARQIIESHGGEITVHPAPGRGATFRIQLPVHVAPPPPSPRVSEERAPRALPALHHA